MPVDTMKGYILSVCQIQRACKEYICKNETITVKITSTFFYVFLRRLIKLGPRLVPHQTNCHN